MSAGLGGVWSSPRWGCWIKVLFSHGQWVALSGCGSCPHHGSSGFDNLVRLGGPCPDSGEHYHTQSVGILAGCGITCRHCCCPSDRPGDRYRGWRRLYTPESAGELTPVEVTQVGLLRQAARSWLTDAFGPASPPPRVVGSLPEAPSAEEGTTKGETKRKIKCCQVLDQSDEAEIPELKQKEIDSYYNRLKEVKGGPVRPESEPSPEQILALKVRILELDLAPYADFGIFVNFQHRFSKALKFLNHVLQLDGTFRAAEVPGPPSYEQWLSSWTVFENTLLMFQTEVLPGVHQPIVTLSALEEFKDAFREMSELSGSVAPVGEGRG